MEISRDIAKIPFYTSKKFLIALVIIIVIFSALSYLLLSGRKDSKKTAQPNSFAIPTTSDLYPVPATNTPKQAKFAAYENAGKMKDGVFVRTDTDNDSLPDWVETDIGTDPTVFECSEYLKDCGNGLGITGQKFEQQNVIIVLDSSGSMAATNNGKTRLDTAKEAVLEYVSQFQGSSVNVGLIVYGHKGNNTEAGKQISCTSIETIYKPNKFARITFQNTLEGFHPTGWTPIAASLIAAKAELEKIPNSNKENSTILLVTDGEETCGGDPVATAKTIRDSGMQVVVDVVALGTDATTNAKLEPIAKAGGGVFLAIYDETQLKEKLYETFKVAQKETAEVIACSGAVIQKWVSCRQDILNEKYYPYLNNLSKNDSLYTASGMNDFLMSFDKNKTDVFDLFFTQTNDEVKKAQGVQNNAADIYKENSNTYQP